MLTNVGRLLEVFEAVKKEKDVSWKKDYGRKKEDEERWMIVVVAYPLRDYVHDRGLHYATMVKRPENLTKTKTESSTTWNS